MDTNLCTPTAEARAYLTLPADELATESTSINLPPLRVVSSTLTGDAIAKSVEARYVVGTVKRCHLLRRGFNHVYVLEFENGQRCIARLSSHRARGEPNVAYEASLLRHLKTTEACVAAPWLTRSGRPFAQLHTAEGTRTLMVFDCLHGNPPGEALPDIEAMGTGLARIHAASQRYSGPTSSYTLDLPYLLQRPLEHLLSAPELDSTLQEQFLSLAQDLRQRIAQHQNLTLVACHGDCHGGNTVVTDGPAGTRMASFFDFDDAGPRYLAYDLAVYLWGQQMGSAVAIDGDKRARWHHFVKGYRSIQPLPQTDFEAIALFVPVRHFWFLGEHASRIHEWGSQALPRPWLQKQVELLTAWMSLATPEA